MGAVAGVAGAMSEPDIDRWVETALQANRQQRGLSAHVVDLPKPDCVPSAFEKAFGGAYRFVDEDDSFADEGLYIAALVLRSLAQDHCFNDGNKRTAYLMCLEVLAALCHVTLHTEDAEEPARFVLEVATGEVTDVRAIAAWLARRAYPLPLA